MCRYMYMYVYMYMYLCIMQSIFRNYFSMNMYIHMFYYVEMRLFHIHSLF